ncbi:glycosyltransferase family 4 protein [Cecembia lonarensis]|uniref:Glycogen synthase n=1 Tax=Cecembia lonarensis (strain CCUG 58316 / KCTC 22772 / LW9) TaxID=1225176 RepID=K1LEF3_CECL9|nr:glycosyltransferase family 4 protein [Cecembia lonarensis]EKB48723.1 Glycogen synthase [Cecembia lonarensis LW9]
MKKKVLFVIDTISVGGAELSIYEVVKNLKHTEPIVCILYKAANGLQKEFEKENIPHVFFDINKRFGVREAIQKLNKLIKEERPDAIHATHFNSEIICRLAVPKFKIPLICSLLNDTYSKERYALFRKREIFKLEIFRMIDRWTAKKADKYISVAECILEPNSRYLNLPIDRMVVVQNGRDMDFYLNAEPLAKQEIVPECQVGDVFLVSNSRVVRSKGFEEMFGAFEILAKKYPNLYLIVVGNGYDYVHYQERAKQLEHGNRIKFLGPRLDMPKILKACDIFWFPTHFEGSPGVVIEAMVCKLPIISTDIPSITENLVDGVNALICKLGDVPSLVEKTEILLQDLALGKKLAEKAFELGVEKFDIKTLAAKQERVYLDLIEEYRVKGIKAKF